MKAITLQQPWASWVANGWKTIETRTHKHFASLEGQRIAIHAGKNYDERAVYAARPYLTPYQLQLHKRTQCGYRTPRGAIICTVFVRSFAQCVEHDALTALIECHKTVRFGLLLEKIELVMPPIFCTGHQGIWEVDLCATRRDIENTITQ
jgi:hypothetical protein